MPTPHQAEIETLLESIREESGWKSVPRVRVTEAVEVPALFGLFRPEMLVPPSVVTQLSTTELRLVLMHELGHWRRCDLYTNFLLALLQAFHWFNPLVWWAFHRSRVESERATDAWVLSRAGASEASTYGKMLLQLLEQSTKPKAVLSGVISVVESPKDFYKSFLLKLINPDARWYRCTTFPLSAHRRSRRGFPLRSQVRQPHLC